MADIQVDTNTVQQVLQTGDALQSHHVPSVMHRDDFTPVNGGSLYA